MLRNKLFLVLKRKTILVLITVLFSANFVKSQGLDTLEYISRIGYCPTGDVARCGNYLYLVDLGLIVLDFTDPNNATIVKHITTPTIDISELIISGDTGYADWGAAGLRNIDFSIPLSPIPIGNTYCKKYEYRNLQKQNNYLYAIGTSILTPDSIYLISVNLLSQTIADSINLKTGFPHDSCVEAKRFIIADTLLYLTMGSRGDTTVMSELHIFNISNPENINHIGSVNIGECYTAPVILQSPTFSLVKRNNYIYVASRFVLPKNHIKIVDVSYPANPQLITAWTDSCIQGWSGDIELDSSGNHLLLTDLYGGLNILSITNDTVLTLCKRITNIIPAEITNFEMRVFNNYVFLYFIDWYATYTVDLTNNSCNAILIDTIPLGHDWRDVCVSDNLYIYSAIWDYMQLYTLDMNNPYTPAITQRTHVKGNGWGLNAVGNYVYMAMGQQNFSYPDTVVSGGLIIFDISDPNHPIQKGWSPPDSLNTDVQVLVDGQFAYIVSGQPNGSGEWFEKHSSTNPELRIINVSNPDNLIETGSIVIIPQCRGIYKDSIYVYIAASSPDSCAITETTGVYIVDVSNPYSPNITGSWLEHNQLKGHTRAVYVKDNYAYVAHDTSLVVLDVSNPNNPIMINEISENCMSNEQTQDVVGYDNFLFVLTMNSLFVYDISNAGTPLLIDSKCSYFFQPSYHLDIKPPYIYVLSSGVYTFKFNALLSSPNIEATAFNFNLFPNPSHETITIQFTTEQAGVINLNIFDISGKIVKNINRTNYPSGDHSVEIDVSNLSVGTYLMIITNGNTTSSKKFEVIKYASPPIKK